MRRIIIPIPDFKRALATLGSDELLELVKDVACRIAEFPERVPADPGSHTHVLHTRSYGPYPAISLWYTFDARTVHLTYIELRDELALNDDEVDPWELTTFE